MTQKIKFLLKVLPVAIIMFIGASSIVYADEVNLTIKNDGNIIFSGAIPLSVPGTGDINDSQGESYTVDVQSVLYILSEADELSSDFEISELIYYSSFNAFYLKCITVSGTGELCDSWMYKVQGADPGVGMDNKILSHGEEILVFFGEENPEPESDPEPEPTIETPQRASGGSSRRVRPAELFVPVEVIVVPQTQSILENAVFPLPNSEPEEIIIAEVPKEIQKVSVKKEVKNLTAENKITKSESLIATVVAANQQGETLSFKKGNWFVRLFNWIFGF